MILQASMENSNIKDQFYTIQLINVRHVCSSCYKQTKQTHACNKTQD